MCFKKSLETACVGFMDQAGYHIVANISSGHPVSTPMSANAQHVSISRAKHLKTSSEVE